MTTNKPEVVAHLYTVKEDSAHRGVSLFHDPSCTNTLIQREPLIRLSDYEALQSECEQLRRILSEVATAAGGSAVPECSLEFLGDIPKEVGSVIARLRKDAARLDWLADPNSHIGNVELPKDAVLRNPHSLRAAIDDAMEGGKP